MLKLIATFANALKLVDQVKKGKQHQEGQEHQSGGRIDLAREVALVEFQRHRNFPHARGFCRR